MFSPKISTAALAFFALSTAAAAAPQDAFEPNDDCTAPPVITVGTTTALTLGADSDYFTLAIPANADINISATDGVGGFLDVELLEAGCLATLATSTAAPLSYFDCGGLARDVVVFVDGTGQTNLSYTLDISAAEIVDDSDEDNDTCSTGALVAISSFTMPGLVVTGCDEDYYAGRLQTSGVEVQVDLVFSHAQGDVDIELYDLNCNTLLASSTSTTDNESVSYINTSNPSTPQAVIIRIFMKNGVGFADYSLTACFGDVNLPAIGTQQCPGVPNSTGRPATLCGRGSDIPADDQVFLYVVDLPSFSAGYFVTSPLSDFEPTPGGSMGNLCLDTPGRYNFDARFTGASSAVFYQPDLPNTPIAGGSFGPILSGTTQYWQYWYRDAVGGMAVSNFSSALRVDFQ